MPSAQTYLAEMAPAPKRGLYSTLIYFSGTAGIVVGTLLGAILTMTLSKEQMAGFGWRIPFAIGALMGLYTLIMRSRLKETEQFEEQKAAKAAQGNRGPSVFSQIIANWRKALQVIGLTVGLTVVYYIWSISTPAYAISTLKMDPAAALWTGVAANIVFMIALPFWGKLSDRIGRRPVLIISCVGAAALQIPMASFVRGEAWQLFISMSVMLIFIAASASIVPAVYAELFPTAIRTVGVAIPYAICVAAFGGTAAFLQAGFAAWFGHGRRPGLLDLRHGPAADQRRHRLQAARIRGQGPERLGTHRPRHKDRARTPQGVRARSFGSRLGSVGGAGYQLARQYWAGNGMFSCGSPSSAAAIAGQFGFFNAARPIDTPSAAPVTRTCSAWAGSVISPTAVTNAPGTAALTAAASGTWKPGPLGPW